MKQLILILALTFTCIVNAQDNEKITTIDFVEVLNNNKAETLYYYQNNWLVLRKAAVKKDYIYNYELLETQPTEDAPFTFILITTYANKNQYDKREDNFGELIKAKGGLKLLNEKQPGDFRKIIYGKDPVKHVFYKN